MKYVSFLSLIAVTVAAESGRENCSNFRKCCKKICQTDGGYQATCRSPKRPRCKCTNSGDQDSPPTPNLDEPACGVPEERPSARIVGGTQATPHSWPWQVSLQMRSQHFCGGSLLSTRHVLTAAHCVENSEPGDFKVMVGMHDKIKKDGISREVAEIHVHPRRNKRNQTNDAAILVLAKPVVFTRNVSHICPPKIDVDHNTVCVATGWGDTKGTGDDRYLRQVQVPMIPNDVCNDKEHYNGKIDDTMVCAGRMGKDACQGDSGGPLVCRRGDGVWELEGVTSWGQGCAQANRPGVYAHVVTMKEWIKTVMQKGPS